MKKRNIFTKCLLAIFGLLVGIFSITKIAVKAEEIVSEDFFVGQEERSGIRFAMGSNSQANQVLHVTSTNEVTLLPSDYIAIRYYIEKQSPDKSGLNFKIHFNKLDNIFYKGVTSDKYFVYKNKSGDVDSAQVSTNDQYLPRKTQGYSGYLVIPCTGVAAEGMTVTTTWIHLENAASQSLVIYNLNKITVQAGYDICDVMKEAATVDECLNNSKLTVTNIFDFSNVSADNIDSYAQVEYGFTKEYTEPVATMEAVGSRKALKYEASDASSSINVSVSKAIASETAVALKLDNIGAGSLPKLYLNGTEQTVSGYITKTGEFKQSISSFDEFRGYVLYTLSAAGTISSIKVEASAKDTNYNLYSLSFVGANNQIGDSILDFASLSAADIESSQKQNVSASVMPVSNIVGGGLSTNSEGALYINVKKSTTGTTKVIFNLKQDLDCNYFDNLLVKLINKIDTIKFGVNLIDADGDIFSLRSTKDFTVNFMNESKAKSLLTVKQGVLSLNNQVPGTLNLPLTQFELSSKVADGVLSKVHTIEFEFDTQVNDSKKLIISAIGTAEEVSKKVVNSLVLSSLDFSEEANAEVNISTPTAGSVVKTSNSNIELSDNLLIAGCTLDYDSKAMSVEPLLSGSTMTYTVTINPGYTLTGHSFDGEGTLAEVSETTFTLSSVTKEGVVSFVTTPITYSITYVLNGGENSSNNPASFNVTTSRITLISPKRNGYTFGGWYTDQSFSEESRIQSIAKGTVGDLVLYAKWNKVEQQQQSGCGSTLGLSILSIVLSASAVAIILKKRH